MNNHPANNAHTGHNGSSGIQNHSLGEDWPVRTVCIGSADRRVATCFGVELHSADLAGHRKNVDLLRRAECITDAIFAARADGEGYSAWINRDDDPEYGWIVGCVGNESKFDADGRNYNAVFADVVGKLEFLDGVTSAARPVCIGSWICDGELYVDICVCHDNFDDALHWGKANDQLAIYSIHEGIDYPL